LLVALSLAVVAVAVPRMDADGYVPVPGGLMLHKSCIHQIPKGFHIESDSENEIDAQRMLVNSRTGEVKVLAPCKYRPKLPDLNLQIYAMDTHFTASGSNLMSTFNATFNAPGLPSNDQGQVVYFWPGFKSSEPTMGFPVLQPVLQYGTDSEGGGNYWCVRSWFVCGQWGMALVSPEVAVSPQDSVFSSMSYDKASSTWIIFANNTATSETTTLKVARTKIRNTDFKVAMLVLETIMDEGDCSQYPSTTSVTFTDVTVNGVIPANWIPRMQMHDCNQNVAVAQGGATVKMTWSQ